MAIPKTRLTLLLCAAAALFEGFDNQSMGVAAPKLLPALGLSKATASLIFSAATLGLFIGAAVGGRAADRFGRKPVLVLSMLLLGTCSLLTAMSSSAESLLVARLLTGLGLGGAMPNFIALSSEAADGVHRLRSTTAVMAAMPMGGALAGFVALGDSIGWSWRSIFYVGGAAPLLLGLAMWRALPDSRDAQTSTGTPAQGVVQVLFGSGRAPTTLLLWGGFFFTQLVLLLMLNWLPSLFVGLGFTRTQASWASICFNLSGSLGSVILASVHAGARRRMMVVLTYAGMAAALGALPLAGKTVGLATLACAFAGVFIVGAQLILFALAPLYYGRPVRGTGVGAAVAVGRLGSVFGPLYAGVLLAGGASSAAVLVGIVPFVVVGGAAALGLTSRATAAA